MSEQQQRIISIKKGTDLNDLPPAGSEEAKALQLDDFWVFAPENKYLHTLTGELWPETSIKRHFHKKAAKSVSQHRSLQTKTWRPGDPQIMENVVAKKGSLEYRHGFNCFNEYIPPNPPTGDPSDIGPWLDLIDRLFPDNKDHLLKWFAHRVQHPGEKINHACLLISEQGTGKDTMMAPVLNAVGPWNIGESSPQTILDSQFNGFLKSVILCVNEARDLGQKEKVSFYENMKTYTAAPPEFLRCNPKYAKPFYVKNCCGVIITSNHKFGGIYLPKNDRRHYVAASDAKRSEFDTNYWDDLWNWYENGGFENVASFLNQYDLSDFNPKEPPPKTPAFFSLVDAGRSRESSEMAACINELGEPIVLAIDDIKSVAEPSFVDWLEDRKNARKVVGRLDECGYEKLVNPDAKDTRWRTSQGKKIIYGNREYSMRERMQNVKEV